MLTDEEYQKMKAKIDREFPIRLKLAELAGMGKINPKNYKACEALDQTIHELYLEVVFRKPENVEAALEVIRTLYK
jgi:hypothetical protein